MSGRDRDDASTNSGGTAVPPWLQKGEGQGLSAAAAGKQGTSELTVKTRERCQAAEDVAAEEVAREGVFPRTANVSKASHATPGRGPLPKTKQTSVGSATRPLFMFSSLLWGPSSSKEPDQILDGLYLGGYQSVLDKDHLGSLNIKSILTVARGLLPKFPELFKYTVVEVEDMPHVDMVQHFDTCFQAIEEGMTSGGVVVHCFAGVSRSATIVIAYLIKTKSMTLKKALGHVRNCRPIINPNAGFLKQLETFEARVTASKKKGSWK